MYTNKLHNYVLKLNFVYFVRLISAKYSWEITLYLSVWQSCLYVLQDELPSQQFSMWVRPLQAESSDNTLTIYAPNRFVLDWVKDKYLNRINELLIEICGDEAPNLNFQVGSTVNISKTAVFQATTNDKFTTEKTDAGNSKTKHSDLV